MSSAGILDTRGPYPEVSWHSQTRLWSNPARSARSVLRGVYWVPRPDGPLPKWVDQFKVASVFDPKKFFWVATLAPTAIGVPRFWGLSRFGTPQRDERTLGRKLPRTWFDFDPTRPLRSYQQDAVRKVQRSFTEFGGAVIHADCAIGKTAISLAISSLLGVRTLFICHRSILIEQTVAAATGVFFRNARWTRILQHVIPFLTESEQSVLQVCLRSQFRRPWIPECRVGVAQGEDLADTRSTDSLVVASLTSLSQFNYPKDFYESFGLVIVDEAHHIGGKTFSQVLPKFPAKFVLGLTATPKRSDGTEHVLYWLLGPIAYSFQRTYDTAPLVAGAPEKVVVLRIQSPVTTPFVVFGSNPLQRFIQCMSELRKLHVRNLFVVECVLDALNRQSRKCVLVVSFSLEQVLWLRDEIKARAPTRRVGVMSQPIKDVGTEDAAPDVIVAVDECSGEGWDFPPIDTVVFATPPRGDRLLQQSIGRGERAWPGKKLVLVVDILDQNNHILRSRNNRRQRFYETRHFKVVNIGGASASAAPSRSETPGPQQLLPGLRPALPAARGDAAGGFPTSSLARPPAAGGGGPLEALLAARGPQGPRP